MSSESQRQAIEPANILPFVSMPDRISIARLRSALQSRPPGQSLAQLGTFIHNGDEIWSFVPLSVVSAALEPVLNPDLTCSRRRVEIEATPAGRNPLSWLLRKHFERHLLGFDAQGLYLEKDVKDPRSYFRGENCGPRTIHYVGRSNPMASRDVVVPRQGGRRAWFRNEGFRYDIFANGENWGVAIAPFYIFTGPDAGKPLPFAAQIEQSKRWNGRDVKTGKSHLRFWQDFLARGKPLVDLREKHIDNLFLGACLVEGMPAHSNNSTGEAPTQLDPHGGQI
jgi:hypothetical protein